MNEFAFNVKLRGTFIRSLESLVEVFASSWGKKGEK